MNRSSYAFDCIVASGFAVMSPAIAYELRPDLWACVADCARTLNTQTKIPGTQRLIVTFEGYGQVLVFARSMDSLEKRLEWIVGQPVISIKQAEAIAPTNERPDPLRTEQAAKESDRMEQVRKLAGEALPSHDCALRREIIAARDELGMPVA
jgi:hypothetical protein